MLRPEPRDDDAVREARRQSLLVNRRDSERETLDFIEQAIEDGPEPSTTRSVGLLSLDGPRRVRTSAMHTDTTRRPSNSPHAVRPAGRSAGERFSEPRSRPRRLRRHWPQHSRRACRRTSRATGRGRTRCTIRIPTSSRSIPGSGATSSSTRRSAGTTSARCGRKGRPGTAAAATWSGATFRTTASCAGWKKTVTSASSAIPPATATATRSTTKGGRSPASTGNRRVARYEHSGEITVIADRFEGSRLNSPNDVVVHPDRSIWFTDPPYGIRGSYEGFRPSRSCRYLSIASTA